MQWCAMHDVAWFLLMNIVSQSGRGVVVGGVADALVLTQITDESNVCKNPIGILKRHISRLR